MGTALRVAIAVVATALNPVVVVSDEPASDSKEPAPETTTLIYKQNPRRTMTVYFPDNWKPSDQRSALVIFRCNIPVQREHFRRLGMVVVKPVLAPVNSGQLPKLSLQKISELPRPRDQVADAKSAIRFLRASAAEVGIDPLRIAATGTSGGGDLALQSYINSDFEDPQDDQAVSPRPNALVLFCPAFDGIDIWFVRTKTLLQRTQADAPAFLPLLEQFVRNTTDEYATPLDHRAELIELAASLGQQEGIPAEEVRQFQAVLKLFNERDWQLLHPYQDALKMSASRILPAEPLPPTLMMFGDRDHLAKYQNAFVETARAAGKEFTLKIFEAGGHSFMTQPAFEQPSTDVMELFLREQGYLKNSASDEAVPRECELTRHDRDSEMD